jgi:hypothetical protein
VERAMEIREKIALYQKLLSDSKLTETQREVIAKLLAEENQKANSAKSHSRCGVFGRFHSLQALCETYPQANH